MKKQKIRMLIMGALIGYPILLIGSFALADFESRIHVTDDGRQCNPLDGCVSAAQERSISGYSGGFTYTDNLTEAAGPFDPLVQEQSAQ